MKKQNAHIVNDLHAQIAAACTELPEEFATACAHLLSNFFTGDFLWFTSAMSGNHELFSLLCRCALKVRAGQQQNDDQWNLAQSFWEQMRQTVCPVLRSLLWAVPLELSAKFIFRGCCFPSEAAMELYLDSLPDVFRDQIQSCSVSHTQALTFCDPKIGFKGAYSLKSQTFGYEHGRARFGLMFIFDGFHPLSVGGWNAQNLSEEEVWVRSQLTHMPFWPSRTLRSLQTGKLCWDSAGELTMLLAIQSRACTNGFAVV